MPQGETAGNPIVAPDGGHDGGKLVADIATRFNHAYYCFPQQTWGNTFWMGISLLKTPTDLWVYQEILFQTRPTVIVETGTFNGGSALYLAHLGDTLGAVRGGGGGGGGGDAGGNGGLRIITVDLTNATDPRRLPQHPRITYVAGSSVDPHTVADVRSRLRPDDRVTVILDSDHTQAHVRAELDVYAPLVSPGCYLIVEDTIVNGHPVLPRYGPGPMEAVNDFLPAHPEFTVDRDREKFMLTFNPGGYLKRN